jgi:hypothetical protein
MHVRKRTGGLSENGRDLGRCELQGKEKTGLGEIRRDVICDEKKKIRLGENE